MHLKMVLIIAYQAGTGRLGAKHIVEETMTKAFVRKCNNCNKAFVKEGGCNGMKCFCGNLQCYVCESDVADYSHFDKLVNGQICPLYGEMQELLKEQVAMAQERTVRELLKTRAELEDDDVRVDQEVGANINLGVPTPPFVQLRANIADPNAVLPRVAQFNRIDWEPCLTLGYTDVPNVIKPLARPIRYPNTDTQSTPTKVG
jgi:hypothetical protein